MVRRIDPADAPTPESIAYGLKLQRLRLLIGRPRFQLGQLVSEPHYGRQGIVDVIYLGLDSAVNSLAVPRDWYDGLDCRPKTAPDSYWYSVVLTSRDGQVLVGQDDLEAAT
jgi:hypothetical protein